MKLVDYLEKYNISQAQFGKKIRRKQTTVSGYCTGSLIPPRATALRIEKVTNGEVTLSDMWGRKIAS